MATKKTQPKTKLFIEYAGNQVNDRELITAVKNAWTDTGRKINEITSMDLYIKPEESAVYYVINQTESGKVNL